VSFHGEDISLKASETGRGSAYAAEEERQAASAAGSTRLVDKDHSDLSGLSRRSLATNMGLEKGAALDNVQLTVAAVAKERCAVDEKQRELAAIL
jgi:hypothetical protein